MAGSTEIGRAHVTVSADTQPLESGLASARQSISSWANSIGTGILQGVGQQIFSGITQGIRSAIGVIGQSVQDASNLTESINKVGVAFGSSAQEILDWSKDSATALGQSQQQALEAASGFGLMFRAMGLATEQSAAMSTGMVELASDLASINNATPEEALLKLRAGLVGEAEPLRTWGVLLDEASTQQKAMQLGLADTTEALTAQDKVLARYQIILDQTALSQGDFANTSDQLANSQRILGAQLEEASATLGSAFAPIQLAFTRGLSELIIQVKPYALNIINSFADGLAEGIIAITPVLAVLREKFTYWLKPGSPPRLLPDLDKWGKEAAEVYLSSWGNADFASLKELGGVIEGILRSFVASGQVGEKDLVKRIFGSQRAIGDAINEFNKLGAVSADTFAKIARESGPAGDKISSLVREYFNLARAAKDVEAAQGDLNKVTQKYADALAPINAQLDNVRRKQQEIRDQQRLQELGKTLTDPTATVDEKQLARLEIQQIELEKQASAIENERDVAVGAAEDKVDAAKKEQDAQQAKFDSAQAALDQQVKTNSLIGEEITLRTRLANEALAAQQKALRDLEAAQREAEATDEKRLAQLERIHQAQLSFQLASTDTAGQLALLQKELANTVEGSAEYYNILTRIAGLQDKLAKEKGDGDTPLTPIAGDVAHLEQEVLPGVDKLSKALQGLFDVATGKTETKDIKLSPFFQGVVDGIDSIVTTVGDAVPVIKDFFNLFTGKDPEVSTADILRPTGGNGSGFWGGIVPFIRGIISAVTLIKDGDWAALWDGFKVIMLGWRNSFDPATEGDSIAFADWILNTLIPNIELIAHGEWARVWENFRDAALGPLKEIKAWFEDPENFGGTNPQFQTPENPKINGMGEVQNLPGIIGQLTENLKAYVEALREATGFGLPPTQNPFITPQSFSPNSSGVISAGQTTNVFYINQTIGTNGDFGGARQGAEDGLRTALIRNNLA